MTWVRFLGYAAFSALGWVYQVVILDKILSAVMVIEKGFGNADRERCGTVADEGPKVISSFL
jgi:hypothetical protein